MLSDQMTGIVEKGCFILNTAIFAPFSAAACDVFRELFNLEADIGAPSEKQAGSKSTDTVLIAIGITGDLSGEVRYCIPEKTTLEMVKRMSGMEFEEVDEIVASAMGEVANIISGNALTNLADMKVNCDLTPPKVLYGESLPTAGHKDSLGTSVKSDIGNVEVDILLAQS